MTAELSKLDREPDRTSRTLGWGGAVVDLHWWRGAGEAVAAAAEHDILAMRIAGTSPLVQRRDGRVDERTVVYGNVTIHPRGVDSHWSWTRPGAIVLMRLPPALLAEAHANAGDTHELPNCFGTVDPSIERHARLMLAGLHRHAEPAQRLGWESLSVSLARHVVQHYGGRSVPADARGSLSSAQLLRIAEFVEDRWQEQTTLQDLADLAGLSRFHFCRLFRQSTGMTPMAFVERARLERARSLVLDSRGSLAEIAALTGFADQSHFSRRFREAYGASPGQFARSYGLRAPRADRLRGRSGGLRRRS